MDCHLLSENAAVGDHFEPVEKFEVNDKVPRQVIIQAIIAIAARILIE
jgi:hypothetical protein